MRRHVLLVSLLLAGCGGSGTRVVGEGDPDLGALRTFDRHPLYWVGERFEQWELERVRLDGPAFVSLSHGIRSGRRGVFAERPSGESTTHRCSSRIASR